MQSKCNLKTHLYVVAMEHTKLNGNLINLHELKFHGCQ